MVGGVLANIGFVLTVGFIGEVVLMATIKKDKGGYKFRPIEWYRDSNLEHYQKFIVVTAVAVLLSFSVTYLFGYVFDSVVRGWIQSFSPIAAVAYDSSLFLIVVGIGTYYTRDKGMDRTLLYLSLSVFVLLLIFGQIEYGILNRLL